MKTIDRFFESLNSRQLHFSPSPTQDTIYSYGTGWCFAPYQHEFHLEDDSTRTEAQHYQLLINATRSTIRCDKHCPCQPDSLLARGKTP